MKDLLRNSSKDSLTWKLYEKVLKNQSFTYENLTQAFDLMIDLWNNKSNKQLVVLGDSDQLKFEISLRSCKIHILRDIIIELKLGWLFSKGFQNLKQFKEHLHYMNRNGRFMHLRSLWLTNPCRLRASIDGKINFNIIYLYL